MRGEKGEEEGRSRIEEKYMNVPPSFPKFADFSNCFTRVRTTLR